MVNYPFKQQVDVSIHRTVETFLNAMEVTFFPLDPANIVSGGAGSALVCQHCLQVVVTAVVGAQVCKEDTCLETLTTYPSH